ncbi:MAG: FAD:protein FMN transferase [Pirellulales bacterium]
MGGLAWVWTLSLAGVLAVPSGEPVLNRYTFARTEMGMSFRIVLYAIDESSANTASNDAFDRIHALNAILSDYDDQSNLTRFCDQAGGGHYIPLNDDLWTVLARSQDMAERSGGAFDVTVGPLIKLWRRTRRTKELPAANRLAAARELVGYRNLQLDPAHRSGRLLKAGMRIDLGGIAPGYAADEAMAILKRHGVTRALVDASGDILVSDPPPGKPGWRIGIAPLDAPDGPPSRYVLLANGAIANSGDAWQFVEIGGRRYSHIVDPRTGLGLTDHSSVTVFGPDGITTDSMATAVSVLGPAAGLKLVEKTPGFAALIVRAPQGKPEIFESRRLNQYRFETPTKAK